MRDALALRPSDCQLMVVDVQKKLAPAMPADRRERVFRAIELLGVAARLMGVPVTVTEHVPDRIGATDPAILAHLNQPTIFGKTHFGAANEPEIAAHGLALAKAEGRARVLVCGMEAHVCVLQTALGLKALGLEVAFVADAACSRHALDEATARERCRHHGIEVVTAEMVAFEWLHRADHPARREVIAAVKATSS